MKRRTHRDARRSQRSGDRVEVVIERLGARGDGIASLGDARLFVPLTLPGDRLQVRIGASREGGFAGEPVAWHERAPRADPRCPHFGICGGCQLQHLAPADDAAWRCAQVVAALARRGLKVPAIEPPEPMAPASRRRARIAFAWHGGRLALGFRSRAGRDVVDVQACALVTPEIMRLLPALRAALARLPLAARAGEALVTAAESGIDLLLLTAAAPGLADREGIAALAREQDLARVSWLRAPDDAEVIVQRRPVRVTFDAIPVAMPPGAFLQATAPAEAELRTAVRAALGPALDGGRVADLFAGCGTFGLPLAGGGCRVHAVEAQADMLAALSDAARAAGLGDRVTAEARDLERVPLAGLELDRLDAVILDPPRTGARAQARALAASPVPRIAMVSCHPATFARDARILVDGGYRLDAIRLIDAFLWSAQIELVGSFARPPKVTIGNRSPGTKLGA